MSSGDLARWIPLILGDTQYRAQLDTTSLIVSRLLSATLRESVSGYFDQTPYIFLDPFQLLFQCNSASSRQVLTV